MKLSNIETVLAYLRGVGSRDADLAIKYVHSVKYKEHNPHVADGVHGVKEWIAQLPKEAGSLNTVRTLQDGPFVVTHTKGDLRRPCVFFDISRFEDGLIAEHWLLEEEVAPANESGHTQIDGPTQAKHLEETKKNKAFVREYYETVHLAGDHGKIAQYVSEDHVRHEPHARDGVAAFLRDLGSFNQPGKPSRTIDEMKFLLGEGDLVFVVATGTIAAAPIVYVDLYRVGGGKLVEHWGFIQPVPPLESRKNGNGVL